MTKGWRFSSEDPWNRLMVPVSNSAYNAATNRLSHLASAIDNLIFGKRVRNATIFSADPEEVEVTLERLEVTSSRSRSSEDIH